MRHSLDTLRVRYIIRHRNNLLIWQDWNLFTNKSYFSRDFFSSSVFSRFFLYLDNPTMSITLSFGWSIYWSDTTFLFSNIVSDLLVPWYSLWSPFRDALWKNLLLLLWETRLVEFGQHVRSVGNLQIDGWHIGRQNN